MMPGPLSPALGDLAGLRIVPSSWVKLGSYYVTGDGDAILCHPRQVERLKAGLEAIEIVHEGMADVLEWLKAADAWPPKTEPRNRPMPARHLAQMIERISALCDVPSSLVEPSDPFRIRGEHGPELFVPDVRGTVLSASVLRGLS